MNKSNCPICRETIQINENVNFLDRVSCPTCHALLEVVGTSPLELDWIYYDEHNPVDSHGRNHKSDSAKCPLCRENVHISSQMRVGSSILCPGCDAQLELVSLVPLELDWPFDDGYEYDSHGDDYYENLYD